MKKKLQVSGFAVATIVLVVALVWLAHHAWDALEQLHRGFASVQTEDIYISSHVDASIQEMNEVLLRINLNHSAEDEATYERLDRDLKERIRLNKDALSTTEQVQLMAQIESAFGNYESKNQLLITGRGAPGAQPSPTTVLDAVQRNAAPVLELCRKLEASERAEQTQFVRDSEHSLAWIRQLLAVVLVILILSAGTALVAINRGVIDPLRLKLMQTRALANRNEKLASLGTLAAGVAHEIRNPLTAINVRLHSLKKNLVPHSSEEEDAQVISHEIQRLEHIVQDFLQFARPADPKLLMVTADSLFTKISRLFEAQLARSSIQMKVESTPDIWLRADPHQIEQVLINLVQNAAESMEAGGTITLRARPGKARLAGAMQAVVLLDVCDTGKGIPPDVKKRMFDPFFTTKDEGTGLGLAVSLRIVEKHGGTIECRSEVNRGTMFTVLLPLTKPDENHEFTI